MEFFRRVIVRIATFPHTSFWIKCIFAEKALPAPVHGESRAKDRPRVGYSKRLTIPGDFPSKRDRTTFHLTTLVAKKEEKECAGYAFIVGGEHLETSAARQTQLTG